MKSKNPHGRWKSVQYDYDALLSIEGDDCLYCLSPRDVQLVLASLDYFGWTTRYTSASGTSIDQETIFAWQGHLGAALMSCQPFRQDPDNPCLLQTQASDGTWTTFADLRLCPPNLLSTSGGIVIGMPDDTTIVPPSSDTYDGRTAPFTPPARGGTSDEAICLASANAENVLYQMHAQVFSRVFVNDATWAGLVLVTCIVGILALPVALSIIVSVIIAGGGMVILAGINLDSYSSTVRARMRCILIAHATNTSGVVTFDYDAVRSDVESRIVGINIYAALDLYLAIIGETGLNRAGATTAISTASCDDCGTCYHEWDFTTSDGGFTAFIFDVLPRATYSAGVGWIAGDAGDTQIDSPTFPSAIHVTQFLMLWAVGHQPAPPTRAGFRAPDVSGSIFATTTAPNIVTIDGREWDQWPVGADFDSMWITGDNPDASQILQKTRIYYESDTPIWEGDVCV